MTPSTEAGKRLLAILPGPDERGNGIAWEQRIEDIETEARNVPGPLGPLTEPEIIEAFKTGFLVPRGAVLDPEAARVAAALPPAGSCRCSCYGCRAASHGD